MENTVPSGYEDLEKWSQQQNDLLAQQQELQTNLVNQQTQQAIDKLEYDKSKIDKDTQKQTKALYTNYQKMANNYGVDAERTAQMGLANSGYAETSKVNLYNNYQRNVTETLNNAQQLKADFDFQINQARQTGNITLAQNQLALYQQRMELLSREYDMRQQQNQFAYQQQRDTVADRQWQQNFDYQKQRADVSDRQWQQSFDYQKSRDTVSDNQWQQTFDYQKSRDAVADSQWERQFELSKKATTSSSGGGSNGNSNVARDGASSSNEPTAQQLLQNMQVIQGVGVKNNIKDPYSGKTFGSPEEMLAYHHYYDVE